VFDALAAAGIDLADVFLVLEEEGVDVREVLGRAAGVSAGPARER